MCDASLHAIGSPFIDASFSRCQSALGVGCILVHRERGGGFMAQIVLGFGSSHGPTIRTQPADWDRLAERDKRDPRYSYDDLLRTASPSLKDELTPEKKQRRFDACQAGV